MSIWLHDIGKITTPLRVMDKAARLFPLQSSQVQNRIVDIRLTAQIDCLEDRINKENLEEVYRLTHEAAERIEKINLADFVTDEQLAYLNQLKQRTYLNQGTACPWLTGEQYAMLSIRKGTLSQDERKIIENHVVVTGKLPSQIKFSPEFSHVRQWAASHHEKLNGKGYPLGLNGTEISFEVRIITILDIFDALVANDRPYKKAKTPDEAIKILNFMVKDGELDSELTAQFIESRC